MIAITTNYANVVSTACNNVADTSLVTWADFDGTNYNIWYKRSGYDWGSTGHYYKQAQPSVRMPEKQEPLVISPNPATSEITLNVVGKYNIMNMLGQTVINNTFHATKAAINISSLPAGIYLLKVNGFLAERFVK